MSDSRDRRAALRAATAQAATRGTAAEARSTPELRPGDLLMLTSGPESGTPSAAEGDRPEDSGVEWLVVSTDAASTLLVPADTRILVGPGDLEVDPDAAPADAPGLAPGPLVVRCHHALTVPGDALRGAVRSGRLPDRTVRTVREWVRRQAAGDPVVGAEARRTGADPEYRAWLEDAVRPACRAVARRAGSGAPLPSRSPWASPATLPWALAALFFLAALGLGVWNAGLRASLKSPGLANYPGFEINLTGPERSLPSFGTGSGQRTVVPLILPPEIDGRTVQVEVILEDRTRWTNELVIEGRSAYLDLPARFAQPESEWLLRLRTVDEREPRILIEKTVILE